MIANMWQPENLVKMNDFYINHSELKAWREKNLKQFSKLGFPTRHVENWKYTDVSSIQNNLFVQSKESTLPEMAKNLFLSDVWRVVFINGHFSAQASFLEGLPASVILLPLDEALAKHPDIFLPKITEGLRNETAFAHLNAVLLNSGFALHVPCGITLERPIQVLCVTTENSVFSMQHFRHIIVLDDLSQACVLEDYCGLNKMSYFNNVATQAFVGQQARLYHYKLQRENAHGVHIANTQIEQEKDSVAATYHFSVGGRLAREDLNYALKSPGANAQLIGFYAVRQQHRDHHTRIDHLAPDCFSQQNYKGIVGENGRAVFNGKIVVHPKAQKTVARQANHNLLLSANAEVDAKPELEIYADDVRCTHGATVGELNADALFYLRSRGIDESTARHILMDSFSNDVIDSIPHEKIRHHIDVVLKESLKMEPFYV